MKKEKIRPIFPVEVFKKVQTYPPHKYYQHLCENLVKYKMMTKKEIAEWDKKFKNAQMTPLAIASFFDVVCKNIWEKIAQENYFIKNNQEASKDDSLSNKLLNASTKSTK